jgi:AcrR family transcriptional regulator
VLLTDRSVSYWIMMEASPVRKDIPPKRRKQILDAAAELFSRSGYHGVTVDAIARRAGISKGNLYWYFKSKREIFQLLFDDVMEQVFVPFVHVMESDATPREQLRAFAEISLDAAEDNPRAVHLLWQIATQPELKELLTSEYSVWMGPFIDYLRPLFAAMGDDDPEGASILYAITLDALMALAVVGPDIYDRQRLMNAVEEKFIRSGRKKDG